MTNSDLQQLAEVWFGGAERRAETPAGSTSTTQTVTATAVEDSSDGSVRVILSDVVIPDEDPPTEDASMTSDEDVIDEPTDFPDVAVELPTAVDVREGDELLVSLYGGDGQLSPVVTAVAAGGDRTREEVQQAAQDASHAAEMAGEAAAPRCPLYETARTHSRRRRRAAFPSTTARERPAPTSWRSCRGTRWSWGAATRQRA